MAFKSTTRVSLLALFLLANACEPSGPEAGEGMAASENTVGAETTLKDAFAGRFLVGAALNGAQYSGRDTLGAGLVAEQFNQVSPENVLKWESIHPEPGRYAFEGPDQYVEFG
jgi:endo-1,4-beta-xylanase